MAANACEQLFQSYVRCLVSTDCFQSQERKAGGATNETLKYCAVESKKTGDACEALHQQLVICQRAQIDTRKRLKGKPHSRGELGNDPGEFGTGSRDGRL